MSAQFLRKCELVVFNEGEHTGLDLSQFRIRFRVEQSDSETPNHAFIKIYNLKHETVAKVMREFTRITLKAGYVGNAQFGTIFDGTIKQARAGREQGATTDTYVELLAANEDDAYNFSIISTTLAPGATHHQVAKELADAMGVPLGYTDLPPQALARGKVMFGMARTYARQLGESNESRFSIQRDGLNLIPDRGFKPGEAIVLNSDTGLIGVPEVQIDGVRVRCLLNPSIEIGRLIRINNADIQGAFLSGILIRSPGRLEDVAGQIPKVPPGNGLYRVMVSEYVGDTRGNEWYSELVCLAVTRAGQQQVQGGT